MTNNIIHIFYFKQTEQLSAADFNFFLKQLPEIFQNDIKAFKHRQSAEASLLGKIILQYAFQRLDLRYSLFDIQIGHKDRPIINNEIDFNISHSGDFVGCAITQSAKVGFDIEKHRKIELNLFRKYFDEKEWSEIQSATNKENSFFDLWTLKESAIKCDGRGVEVLSKTHKQFADNNIICDTTVFYYRQLLIEDNYSCAVCSNKLFSLNTRQLSLKDLHI